jgi:hypothetical protein
LKIEIEINPQGQDRAPQSQIHRWSRPDVSLRGVVVITILLLLCVRERHNSRLALVRFSTLGMLLLGGFIFSFLLGARSSCFCIRETANPRGARSTLSFSTQSGDNAAFRAEHKTLDQIFNGERNFLFTAQKNVRSYEWTSEEAEELLESIISLEEDDSLQLNSITLMEKSLDKEDRKKIGKNSKVYDVSVKEKR